MKNGSSSYTEEENKANKTKKSAADDSTAEDAKDLV